MRPARCARSTKLYSAGLMCGVRRRRMRNARRRPWPRVLAGMVVAAWLLPAGPAAAETPKNGSANRLIDSANPYLLQHAHNPVDWYPWGAEAIARAKKENKPIFLSVGYSTCYWCHVAERTIYS